MIANQLKLIAQHNFHRHKISWQLYSGARPLYRPKKNAISIYQVACIHSRYALKVKWGIHSQLKTVSPHPHTGREIKQRACDDRFTRLPFIGAECMLKLVSIHASNRLARVVQQVHTHNVVISHRMLLLLPMTTIQQRRKQIYSHRQ